MTDFLLELLSEEIPARMQSLARNELARLFAECSQVIDGSGQQQAQAGHLLRRRSRLKLLNLVREFGTAHRVRCL